MKTRFTNTGSAFTLLEVMIAVAVFFMATFAVLALVAQNLRTARMLQVSGPSFGTVAADLALTNRIEEGAESGDFGELYPDVSWVRDVHLVHTNGLYQADIVIIERRGDRVAGAPVTGSTVIVAPRASLLWKPTPPFRYSSVRRQGPRVTVAFGLSRAATSVPPLRGWPAWTAKR
jgi:hypothetical protein